MGKIIEYVDTTDLSKTIIGSHRWIRPRMQQYFGGKGFISPQSLENYLSKVPKSREFTDQEKDILRYSLRYVFSYRQKYGKPAPEDLYLKPTRVSLKDGKLRLPIALKEFEVDLSEKVPRENCISLIGIRLPNKENTGYIKVYHKKQSSFLGLEDSQVFLLEGRTR